MENNSPFFENTNSFLKEINSPLTRYIGGLGKLIMEQGRLKIKEKKVPIDFEQLPVLMCVFISKQITQQEIAKYVNRDKASVKRTVTLLQKRGLVEIHSHQNDKRKTIVSTTKAGNAVAKQVKEVMHDVENTMFYFLSKKTRKELLDTLKKIFEKNINIIFSKTAKVALSAILFLSSCLPTLSDHLSKNFFNY